MYGLVDGWMACDPLGWRFFTVIKKTHIGNPPLPRSKVPAQLVMLFVPPYNVCIVIRTTWCLVPEMR